VLAVRVSYLITVRGGTMHELGQFAQCPRAAIYILNAALGFTSLPTTRQSHGSSANFSIRSV
jgi:hypothetical protein